MRDAYTGPSLVDVALSYAARGWPVFPCHTPTTGGCSCRRACGRIGKHPRTQHGLKDATTDPATIQRWWAQWPQANIAIVTGAVSRLVVLDEDTYKGGDTSRVALEQSYSSLPETVQQLTGGGVQYVFAHPGTPVKNGVETLGAGLDIRGDGGYVIVPPSLHVSGKRYAWEVLHEPNETPLAPMPAWLLALCQESTRREAPSARDPIPQGQRNQTLFQLGCAMRARGFSEAAIAGALTAINTTQCQPPLAEAEVATIAASCAQYPTGQAREDAHQRHNGQQSIDLSSALVSFRDMLTLTLPERRRYLPWLPERGLAMVYGPRGIGKTLFMLGLATHLVTGQRYLGWESPQPAGVLYIDGEMPLEELRQRAVLLSEQ